MYVIYDKGYFIVSFSRAERDFKFSNGYIFYPSFLSDYSQENDGFFYPNLIKNDKILYTLKNDVYYDLVAKKTCYDRLGVLESNGWFIDYDGLLKELPLENKQRNIECVRRNNSYTYIISEFLKDGKNIIEQVLPRPLDNITILDNETVPPIKLNDYFEFEINTANYSGLIVTFKSGILDNYILGG